MPEAPLWYNGGRPRPRATNGEKDRSTPKENEMENMEMTVEGNTLTIKVNLESDLGLSKSGKTRIIATSRGNAKIPGTDATIGLNIYKRV